MNKDVIEEMLNIARHEKKAGGIVDGIRVRMELRYRGGEWEIAFDVSNRYKKVTYNSVEKAEQEFDKYVKKYGLEIK